MSNTHITLSQQLKATPLTPEEVRLAKMNLCEYFAHVNRSKSKHFLVDRRAFGQSRSAERSAIPRHTNKHRELQARLRYQQAVQSRSARNVTKVKIELGTHSVGDMIAGKIITGLGKAWKNAATGAFQCYAYLED